MGLEVTGWCSQGCQGIVDTGTFLLTVPGPFMPALLQALGAQDSDRGVGWGPEIPESPKEQNIPPETGLKWGEK